MISSDEVKDAPQLPKEILLGEDNLGDVYLVRSSLANSNLNHNFYHVCDGEEIMAYLHQERGYQNVPLPDLILLDLSLPDSRGFETLKTLKEHSLETPIVILSGIDDEKLAIQAVKQGAQDYLVKGQVTGETLIHALRYAIERKHIEEQLKTKTYQLQALNQELKAFNYMVSHDLRNPLTVVKGMSTLLQQKYQTQTDNEREKVYVEHICQACDRMEQIIQDLLVLSQVKEQELSVAPVNLSHLAQNVVGRLEEQQPSRQVNVIIQPNIMAIGDRNMLNHAIKNLLQNAWKYTAERQESRIELGVIDSNPTEVSASLSKLDLEEIDDLNQRNRIRSAYRKLVYFIRDNGIGFNSTTSQKLFTPFHRLDNAKQFQGTGIGLAIVKSIIHRHNGTVWAKAEENRGATFFFTLGL